MSKKNILIVYAHQEPKSFNGALKDAAVETFEKMGHDVVVSDLFAMQFKATTTKDDIVGSFEPVSEHFKYNFDASAAAKRHALSADIVRETEKLKKADLLIFQFPMHWFGVPSILKGWLDRILIMGETFNIPGFYSQGMFKGKRGLLSLTTGGAESLYTNRGIHGDMDILLWPLQNGILNFLGYDTLEPNIAFGVGHMGKEGREKFLEQWKDRLTKIFDEKPVKFFKVEDFENNGFGPLKQSVVEEALKDGTKIPIGQAYEDIKLKI